MQVQFKSPICYRNLNYITDATKAQKQGNVASRDENGSSEKSEKIIGIDTVEDESQSLGNVHPPPDFKPHQTLKKSKKSTRQWLLENLGGCDEGDPKKCHNRVVPAPTNEDWLSKYYQLPEIEQWLESNDATIRTIGQIIYLYWRGYNGTTGLSIQPDPTEPKDRDKHGNSYYRAAFPHRLGVSIQGVDAIAPNDDSGINNPGEEIDDINWVDLLERNQKVVSRTEFFKKNWEKADIQAVARNEFKLPWRYIGKFLDYFKNEEGGIQNITIPLLDRFLNDRKRINHRMYYQDINTEAYARYLMWVMKKYHVGMLKVAIQGSGRSDH